MKLNQILEVRVSLNDPEMDDVGDRNAQERYGDVSSRGAPYAVGWSAQALEWYGDDDPAEGKGRYKPKGDGGKVVAINVPNYETAQRLADKLDADYQADHFYDKNVYGHMGKDYYILQYHGAWVRPMSELDETDHISHDVKDYGKQ